MRHAIILLVIAITTFCQPVLAQQTKYDDIISEFIQNVKTDSVAAIAQNTVYNIEREYPIPAIDSKKEFIRRYDQIFDKKLKQLIINSDIHEDWSAVGWRGIMLYDGLLWLDRKGNLIAINYQSEFERKQMKQMIASQKAKLHPSLKKFKEPVLFMKTEHYKIRIDKLGDRNFRYTSWPLDKTQSDKPGLILTEGEVEYSGSGGNHHYIFKKGDYNYLVYVTVVGTRYSPPAVLEIRKNGEEILIEPALMYKGE